MLKKQPSLAVGLVVVSLLVTLLGSVVGLGLAYVYQLEEAQSEIEETLSSSTVKLAREILQSGATGERLEKLCSRHFKSLEGTSLSNSQQNGQSDRKG